MAITWRNINVDLPDPVRLLGNAQQAVANMQRALNEELDRNQELTKHNLEARTNYLKGQLLNYVAGLKTEEEIEQARKSGVIDELLKPIPVADRSEVVNALDHRSSELQQQRRAALEMKLFEATLPNQLALAAQDKAKLESAEARDMVASWIAKGTAEDLDRAEQWLNTNKIPEESPLYKEITEARRRLQNDAYTRQLRSWEADERRQQQEAKQLQMSVAGEFVQANARQLARVQELAKQYGIPLDKAGLPVRTEQNSAQFEAFTQALIKEGLNGVNDTGYQKQLLEALVKHGITPDSPAGQSALRGLTTFIKGFSELGAQDQTRLNEALKRLETDYTNARTRIEAQILESLRDNPFASVVGKEQPTVKELVEILTKSKDYDPLGIDSFTSEDLPADITKLLSEGIEVKGQKIPITPALLQQVLPGLVSDWDPEDDLADPLIKMFEEKPELIGMYKKAYEAQAQLDKLLAELDAKKIMDETRLYNQTFRDSGNPWLALDRFLRTINEAAERSQNKGR